jgi:glycosyltransferase involved in cell wall biosynthesis
MCRSIASSGHEVSFVVPAERDEFIDGVSIKAVPVPPSLPKRLVFCTWQVFRRAAKEHADVYHFHDPELIFAGLALRYLQKCEVIYDIHENMPDQILCRPSIPPWLRKLMATACDLVERHAGKRYSALVTANEDISERFRKANSRAIEVHNYVEKDEFRCAGDNSARFASGIVFHSGASDRTAFPAVLKAIRLIPKDLSFRLLATGNAAAATHSALEMVQKEGCEHVDVVGPLPREEMVSWMLKSAISLVLYSEERNHASIRANRFYESLAAAVPVIAPDFPEWRAAVESIGCGLVVDPSDPSAIADAITWLLSNPAEAAEMGCRGQQAFRQSFSWEHETEKLLCLYKQITMGQQTLNSSPQPVA